VPSRTSQYWIPFAAVASCSHCGTESAAASCGLVAADSSPACNMSSPVQPGNVGSLVYKPPAYAQSSATVEVDNLHCCNFTCRKCSCQESAALQSTALINAVRLAVCSHHWNALPRPRSSCRTLERWIASRHATCCQLKAETDVSMRANLPATQICVRTLTLAVSQIIINNCILPTL